MKFGQNPTIRDMAKIVDDRLGRTTGASKGNHALTKWKVKPSGTNPLKGKVGIKATKKF